jgi:hypothetical protein
VQINKKKMKKLSCIILFLLSLFSLKVAGQSDSTKQKNHGFIQVSGGIGIPINGDFFSSNGVPASNNPNFLILEYNFANGVATIGENLNISIGSPLSKSPWGLMGMANFAQNFYDNAANYAPGINMNVIGNYSQYSFLVGGYYCIRKKIILFEFKALTGPLYFTYPGMTYSLNMGSSLNGAGSIDGTWYLKDGNTLSLAFDFGAGIKLFINDRLFFLFNIDAFISSKVSGIHQDIQFTDATTGQISYVPNNSTLSLFLLNINAGLGYSIGK